MASIKCKKCGKKVEENWDFCKCCGNSLKENYKPNIKNNTISKKYKIVAIIISIIIVIINILMYFIDVNIIYQIKFGNVHDFFKIVFNVICIGLLGTFLGIIITILISFICSVIKSFIKLITKDKINIIVVLAIITIILASIFVYKAFDVKNNYRNSEYVSRNAYVNGDAYNYIINASYFTGYLTFGGSLYIISTLCFINYFSLKNKIDNK